MGLMNPTHLAAGMVLAVDVKNRHGNTLLKVGAVLTVQTITLLKTWGVPQVDVLGQDDAKADRDLAAQHSPEQVAAVDAQLAAILPQGPMDAVTEEIVRVARRIRLQRLGGGT